ncbi:MAG TPA: hypothetical protein VE733_17550 [Streptosporangiaceae bacterium]|jgi:hypothetical protein|nr:hypothetical protein [Streptosporangiaceae bacterium]
MLTPAGKIITADIKNCRIVLIAPPAHSAARIIGETTQMCLHDPPRRFGSPNGAFPLTDGNYLVTEINGDRVDEMSLHGHVAWSANPPGVAYPSDTNEVYPGRYLTADYTNPGQVVEFDAQGRLLWRLGGFNQPSLALPLPNGDVLLNDDFNHRVVVVDPSMNRIVWQYGHTGISGRAPGYLKDPDGVDLAPPDSLLITHASTTGEPSQVPKLRKGDRLRQTAECAFHADRHSYRPKLLSRMEWRWERARLSRSLQEVPGGTW